MIIHIHYNKPKTIGVYRTLIVLINKEEISVATKERKTKAFNSLH